MPVTVEHSGTIACLGCGQPLPMAEVTSPEGVRCPRCQARQLGKLFPAAFTPPSISLAPDITESGEASCFQHPTKRVAVPCDSCGRFLCTLCQFSLGNQNLCPSCIAAARKKQSVRWISRRLNLDSVALATATIPMLGIWTTLVGGPVAIYLGIRAFSQAPGPVPRGRWRAIAAIVLGTLQVIGWILLFATILGTALFRGGRLG
jgi:DNA-directed RNA polymerase subunit RPC12/RpoP